MTTVAMKCWETERNRNSLRQDATCYNVQHCVFKQFTLWYKGSETRRYNSQEDIASTFPGELPSSKQTLCDPDHVLLFTLKFQILRVVVAHLLIPRLVVWSQSAKVSLGKTLDLGRMFDRKHFYEYCLKSVVSKLVVHWLFMNVSDSDL